MGTNEQEIPRAKLFQQLREMWMTRKEDTSSSLAAVLGVPRQKVNDYATGARATPDWVLQRMAAELNVEIRMQAVGVYVVRGAREPGKSAIGAVIPWEGGK